MTGRPEFFVDESDINKEYFPSFTIIISTLINQKIPFFSRKPTVIIITDTVMSEKSTC